MNAEYPYAGLPGVKDFEESLKAAIRTDDFSMVSVMSSYAMVDEPDLLDLFVNTCIEAQSFKALQRLVDDIEDTEQPEIAISVLRKLLTSFQ